MKRTVLAACFTSVETCGGSSKGPWSIVALVHDSLHASLEALLWLGMQPSISTGKRWLDTNRRAKLPAAACAHLLHALRCQVKLLPLRMQCCQRRLCYVSRFDSQLRGRGWQQELDEGGLSATARQPVVLAFWQARSRPVTFAFSACACSSSSRSEESRGFRVQELANAVVALS